MPEPLCEIHGSELCGPWMMSKSYWMDGGSQKGGKTLLRDQLLFCFVPLFLKNHFVLLMLKPPNIKYIEG